MQQLEQQGIMTDHGRKKIEEARQNGQWSIAKPAIAEEQIALIASILKEFEPAYSNDRAQAQAIAKPVNLPPAEL